ncbi:MAG TPA: T9SS type A sorting domain-containing protein [Bacteroidia bacterium]|nr:T9SS type A sorting domain-containing protein [Bacteroidia bacterium]
MRSKIWLVAGLFLFVVCLLVGFNDQSAEAKTFHTDEERARLHDLLQAQPYDTNTYFATGGRCSGCHGHDPNGSAFITQSGEDVNIADDWAGTMMANSAKDPLWRAKVSHEILVNPALQIQMEDQCARCHAPTGRFEAHYLGQPNYSMASLAQDSFGLDGVNCSACHQLKDTLAGNNFSGDLHYTQKHVFGPYADPVSAIMEFFVGFEVEESQHVTRSEICGGCHSLLTETADLAGNLTGGKFIEQATYHEWKNSVYSTTNTECQHCHIPRIPDSIKIATDYPWLDPRSPFGKHHLVGGNAFMLKLMRDNMTTVGATCTPANFDTTIARTIRYLRDSTLRMVVVETARTPDTAFFDVQLENKCGHKFPSGYPSRIAWVEFVVTDLNSDTIFASGLHDVYGNVTGRDALFEPHHDLISDSGQVQIYEMVMGDVSNFPTTVLARADTCLKDNRLVPTGFSTAHLSYDTTQIIGINGDPDFNYAGASEGTGADIVHYHVPLNGYAGPMNLTARVYYSAVPAQWLAEMFTYSSPEINSFQTMFNNADHAPMLVAETIMLNTITNSGGNAGSSIDLFPNPTSDGKIIVAGLKKEELVAIRVYDLSGKMVLKPLSAAEYNGFLQLPAHGVFLVAIQTKQGEITRKVLW